MTIKFVNLGCKVNLHETEQLRKACYEAGFSLVEENEKADLVVINSCTVTHMSDRKSRQQISRAKRDGSKVVVMGCYVDIHEEIDADLLIPNEEKDEALAKILELVAHETWNQTGYTYDKTRAFLKVQDGCNQFCSYCIIPHARGRAKSYPYEQIKQEVVELLEHGFKEIVLTGINLSSFGKEWDENLGYLLTELKDVIGEIRLRLGSLEPHVITENFLRRTQEIPGFCPQFHLSLQSGSETVLKRMNRHYTPDEYKAKVKLIRKVYPHAAITTDVIVGFPEETEEEFRETMAFVEEIAFSHMHIFSYSPRQGTPAARRIDLHPEVKKRRNRELHDLAAKLKEDYLDGFVGKEVEVLFEQDSRGLTREYIQVFSEEEKPENTIETLVVKERKKEELRV